MGIFREVLKGSEERGHNTTIIARVLAAILGTTFVLTANAQGLPFTEDFSGDGLKDAAETTADWDTGAGVLSLPSAGSASPVQSLNGVFLPGATSTPVDAGDEARTRSVALGDLDGDGDLDLAFANDGLNSVYFNDGSGGFVRGSAIPDDYFTGSNSRSVTMEDYNGDGFLDVAFAEFGGGQASRIHFNNGSRSSQVFTAGEFVDLGPADLKGDSIQSGDIDNDGDIDIVLGVRGDYVQLFRNDGFGNFADPEPVTDSGVGSVGFHARSVKLGDLDGDGDLDIVAAREYDDTRVYINNGGGDYTTLPSQSAAGGATNSVNSPDSIALGDVNGDGLLDLVIGNDGSGAVGSAGAQRNRLYLNSGNAANVFPSVSFSFSDLLFTNGARLADVDRDGDLDIITADSTAPNAGTPEEIPANNHLYLNDPTANAPNIFPAMGTAITGDVLTTKSVEVGDIDRDGDLDLVFVQQQDDPGMPSTTGVNHVVFNTGTLSGNNADQVFATGQSLQVNLPGNNLASGLVVDVDVQNGDANQVFQYWLSDDGGISWWLAHPGSSVDFTDPVSDDLRWRVEIMSPSPALRPDINSLSIAISSIPRFQSTPVTDASQGVLYTYDITTRDNDRDDLTDIRATSVLPAWLTLIDNNDGTAVLSGTPTATDVGTVDVSLEARDTGGRTDTQDFTITIADTPDAPVVTAPLGDQTFTQGDDVTIDVTGVFTDPDMDPLTYSATGLPASLALDGMTGIISGTLTAADVAGSPYAVAVTADDGTSGTATDNWTLTIIDVMDAPSIDSTPVTASTEGVAYTYNIAASDPDPGATLTISAPTIPGWLNFTDNGDGTASLTGTPAAGNVGNNAVVIRVTDNDGMTADQSFDIVVSAAAPPPPPPPPPSSGGGGASSLFTLLALAGILLGRRRRELC
jgi:hypothetical protein